MKDSREADRDAHHLVRARPGSGLVLIRIGHGTQRAVETASHAAVEKLILSAVGKDGAEDRLDAADSFSGILRYRRWATVPSVETIAGVEHPPVVQHDGLEVRVRVEADLLDVASIGVHRVQDARSFLVIELAVSGAVRAKDDPAIRQVIGIDVVAVAERQLSQSGAVEFDLVDVKSVRLEVLAHGEQDLRAVVREFRTLHGAVRQIGQVPQFAVRLRRFEDIEVLSPGVPR